MKGEQGKEVHWFLTNGTDWFYFGSLNSIQWYQLMIKMFYENIGEKLALCKFSQNSTQPDIHVDDSSFHIYPP